ncbi:MAG: DUF4124 domain-containing protein [Acidiferrobacterales bacterium]|nr:DUF4124 domain-containing protein [Acidiferrobacterales bacterium]
MKEAFLLVLLILPICVHAEIYKWIDDDGNVHFGDSLPADANPEKLDLKVNSYSGTSFGTAVSNSSKVEMYSTSWCGYCKKAKQYFAANDIDYIEYDIEDSLAAKLSYEKLGGRGVPVILYNGQRMNGFSEAGFERIYKNN